MKLIFKISCVILRLQQDGGNALAFEAHDESVAPKNRSMTSRFQMQCNEQCLRNRSAKNDIQAPFLRLKDVFAEVHQLKTAYSQERNCDIADASLAKSLLLTSWVERCIRNAEFNPSRDQSRAPSDVLCPQ